MSSFTDARTVPQGTVLDTDLLIVGGGPAGISLALALAQTQIRVLLLESGGMRFEAATQNLYDGPESGIHYLALNASRLRYLGGSTNHWGGWCRPLDRIDFEERSWVPHSGWPFGREALEPYYARAQALVEAGPYLYDDVKLWEANGGPPLGLGEGGVETTYFQYSKMRGSVLPTHFGERYADDLRRVPNLRMFLHANVAGLPLTQDGKTVDRADVATLSDNRFTVKPRMVVLATGAIENARLLLASTDVQSKGIGNGNDLVGRFFADHPIPANNATMVVFNGQIARSYLQSIRTDQAIFRAALAPSEKFKRESNVLGALITVDSTAQLDDLGRAATATAAASLGIDAGNAKAFTLGCGMEVEPDPERRITLSNERDALGMPRPKLEMRVADSDFARYRATLSELGRQLLASGTGILRIRHNTRDEWLAGLDWGNHHMGTTRMNNDAKKGVVDANSQIHGVQNLFVAGSGVFPTYGASNPTMNLIALTLRLADHLKGMFT